MRRLRRYLARIDIPGILLVLAMVCLSIFVVVGFNHRATGFGPDWDCKPMPKGDPVCTRKLSR